MHTDPRLLDTLHGIAPLGFMYHSELTVSSHGVEHFARCLITYIYFLSDPLVQTHPWTLCCSP